MNWITIDKALEQGHEDSYVLVCQFNDEYANPIKYMASLHKHPNAAIELEVNGSFIIIQESVDDTEPFKEYVSEEHIFVIPLQDVPVPNVRDKRLQYISKKVISLNMEITSLTNERDAILNS